jgi:hypothetical protein
MVCSCGMADENLETFGSKCARCRPLAIRFHAGVLMRMAFGGRAYLIDVRGSYVQDYRRMEKR